MFNRYGALDVDLPRIVILSVVPFQDAHRIRKQIGAHGPIIKPSSLEQINEAMDLAMA